jgi:hypothetical protein
MSCGKCGEQRFCSDIALEPKEEGRNTVESLEAEVAFYSVV